MTDTSDTAVNQLPHLRTGVRVQLSSPDGKLQLFTPFVGIEGDKAVILHLPSRSEVEKNNNNERAAVIWYENLLQNKPGVVVRFIEGGVVYAFKCSVLDVVTGKVQLLVLEYPKDICTRCVRKEPRYDCTLRVKLLSDIQQEGLLKDLSYNGCQVRLQNQEHLEMLKELKSREEKIDLEMLLPFGDDFEKMTGKVISVLSYENELRVGVAFEGKTDPVKGYLDLLQLQNGLSMVSNEPEPKAS
ncbi:flagellar brake protein [Pontibacterium sp.]|uniref:flagellar brake protein n=1 Tax=Pontibacterium sp. TaxID=2036026 RepID=UPI00351518BC